MSDYHQENQPDLALVKGEQPVFNILRASAGSGKTFNLVRFYLGLCLKENNDDYFKHILAITFTNKAANEMKERVIAGMRDVSRGKGDHLSALVDALNLSTEEVVSRAVRAYHKMLTAYGQLSIMTIDKFVNRLVRQFSRDLAISSEFQVQLEQDELVREGVDLLLSKIGSDNPDLTKVMERYALQRVDEEKSWDMRGDLLIFGKLLFDEQVKPMLSALDEYSPSDFIQIYDRFRAEINALEKNAQEAASKITSIFHAAKLEASDFTGKYAYLQMEKLSRGENNTPSATVQAQFKGDRDFYNKGAHESRKQIIDAIAPELYAAYEPIEKVHGEDESKDYRTKKMLLGSLFQLAVLQQLEKAVKEVSEARNSMTFSDLNRLIELLVNDNPAPFIYERYGERYKHFLIDEFQDTSIVQWQNFLPLVEESLSYSRFNLIVGDGKQAIYRWRNGDVRQLQQLPKLVGRSMNSVMKGREESLERAAVKSNLEDNWRSLKTVVGFNNNIFEALRETLPEHLRDIYQNLSQNPRGGDGGWVTAQAYFDRERDNLQSLRMDAITEIIRENRKVSGLALRDIAILVRDNKRGSAIARALLDKGINTVTAESLQLGLHPAPCAVINLMLWLSDRRNMAAATKFVLCISACLDSASHPSGHRPDAVLTDALFERMRFSTKDKSGKWQHTLRLEQYLKDSFGIDDTDVLIGSPLYEMVDQLVSILGIGERFPAYAETLLQLAYDYQARENDGLPGFLDYWESKGKKKSIEVPDDMDGVRIMTVHRSKGLEFPVVICLVSSQRESHTDLYAVKLDESKYHLPMSVVSFPSAKNTAVHDQYEEERARRYLDEINVIYVGFTRAVAHLHVLIEGAQSGDKQYKAEKTLAHALNEYGDPYSERIEIGSPLDASAWVKLKEKKEDQEKAALKIIDKVRSFPAKDRLKVGVEPIDVARDGSLNAKALGEELHAILARIRDVNDLDAIEQMAFPWQRMNPGEWNSLLALTRKVVNHPQAGRWFAPGVTAWNERELMNEKGEILRPDRIVALGYALFVIDYKTGKKDEKHLAQVRQYVDLLRRMQTMPVEAWLIYTNDEVELVNGG